MLLWRKPSNTIVFGGKKYKVDFDFAVILQVIQIFKDRELIQEIKIERAIQLLGVNVIDKIGFLNHFMTSCLYERESKGDKSDTPILDFKSDSPYIYASFLAEYNIDLHQVNMHWYKFLDLFESLSEESKIKKIMAIRSQPLPAPNKHNHKQRVHLMKQKAIYSLEHTLTDEEREAIRQKKLREMAEKLYQWGIN